jgi:hypothetical protein
MASTVGHLPARKKRDIKRRLDIQSPFGKSKTAGKDKGQGLKIYSEEDEMADPPGRKVDRLHGTAKR